MRKKGEKEKFDDEGEDEDYVTSPDISSDEEVEREKEVETDPARVQQIISTPSTNQEEEDEKQTSNNTTRPSYDEGIS